MRKTMAICRHTDTPTPPQHPPNRHAAPVRQNASKPPNSYQKTAHRCANTKTTPETRETRENPENATIHALDAQTPNIATVE